MNTLFIKAIRDLLTKKVQSLIIIVALSLGVIGVGAILNVYIILKREMQKNYDMTNPPHFIFNFDSLPSGLGNLLRELESSSEWEYRGIIEARVLSGDGTWKTMILEVVPDFDTRKIDRFFGVSFGTGQNETYPAIGTIFLEKAALPVAKKNVGEHIYLDDTRCNRKKTHHHRAVSCSFTTSGLDGKLGIWIYFQGDCCQTDRE